MTDKVIMENYLKKLDDKKIEREKVNANRDLKTSRRLTYMAAGFGILTTMACAYMKSK